jgi:hypothetical protein
LKESILLTRHYYSRQHKLGVPGVSLISIMMQRSMMLASCRRRVGIEARPRSKIPHVAHEDIRSMITEDRE